MSATTRRNNDGEIAATIAVIVNDGGRLPGEGDDAAALHIVRDEETHMTASNAAESRAVNTS